MSSASVRGRLSVKAVLVTATLTTVACMAYRSPLDAAGPPLMVIRVLQDVLVRREGETPEPRGVLYGDTTVLIRKGEQFQMLSVEQEGGCRIRYAARVITVASCHWLPGFTDPQRDIFEIVSAVPPSRSQSS
jgi:hypothetical protein